MQSSITLRYSDVIMAVAIAKDDYNCNLTRIQLQKYIYLVDTLSAIWNLVKSVKGHETYRHGPYDQYIQNAVDTLAFRGFIEINNFEILDNGKVFCRYGITNVGKGLLVRLSDQPYFQDRFEMYKIIAKEIDNRGWSNLVALVYAEPTYLSERQKGWGRPLMLDSMLTNQSLQMITMIENVASAFNNELPQKTLVSLYFDMLSSIIETKNSTEGDDHEYLPIT